VYAVADVRVSVGRDIMVAGKTLNVYLIKARESYSAVMHTD